MREQKIRAETLQSVLVRKELKSLRARYDKLRRYPIGGFAHTKNGLEAAEVIAEELAETYQAMIAIDPSVDLKRKKK